MATKSQLSRQYVYARLTDLNFDLSTATTHNVAFKDDPSVEPAEQDWVEAIVVTSGHDLYDADIGDSLAILVGPERGDVVTTEDLTAGEYLMWSDVAVPGSDERIVVWHGSVEVVAAPGTF